MLATPTKRGDHSLALVVPSTIFYVRMGTRPTDARLVATQSKSCSINHFPIFLPMAGLLSQTRPSITPRTEQSPSPAAVRSLDPYFHKA